MKILAIETSMGRTSAALHMGRNGDRLVRRLEPGEPQAERLVPLLAELMAGTGELFQALDRIAVCIGPGGFSGVRTGVAVARGIGLAASVPVAGATSFRIMAQAFEKREEGPAVYGLAAPAGQSAVFCQILGRGCTPLTEIVALPHAEVPAFFQRAEAISGPGALTISQARLVSTPVLFPGLAPDASILAEIAPTLDLARDLPSPYYGRPADARPQDGHVIARKKD